MQRNMLKQCFGEGENNFQRIFDAQIVDGKAYLYGRHGKT